MNLRRTISLLAEFLKKKDLLKHIQQPCSFGACENLSSRDQLSLVQMKSPKKEKEPSPKKKEFSHSTS